MYLPLCAVSKLGSRPGPTKQIPKAGYQHERGWWLMQLRALFATSKNNLPASLQSAPCSARILPPARETNTFTKGCCPNLVYIGAGMPKLRRERESPISLLKHSSSASHNHPRMSQYHKFEHFTNLNYAPGSHKPTPPPAYLPAAPTAGHRGPDGGLCLFPIAHTSLPQTEVTSNHKTLHEQLLILQDTMKWVVKNQHEVLEKMEAIMSNQARAEESLKALGTSLARLSEDFENWKRESRCDACEGEGERYTDAVVDHRYLP